MAHQGCKSRYLGNTRSSLECAVKTKVPFIETDLRSTKDKEIFLFHDKRVIGHKISNSSNSINSAFKDLSSEQIKTLCYNDEKKDCILSFQEALKIIKGSTSRFLLDMKQPVDYSQLVSIVNRYGMFNNVVFACQNEECLEFFTKVRVEYTDTKFSARLFDTKDLERYLTYRPLIVQVDADDLKNNMIKAIHAVNAKVLIKAVDICDDQEGWKDLLDSGADLILSDKVAEIDKGGL